MIISASRRTDIPAFYSRWLMSRLRAGNCLVPNPFNRNQISRVSLEPSDVDVIVFWTRNPRPLMAHLAELDDRGYRYYFLQTLMANPRRIDPGSPSVEAAIETFRDLSERIGPERVIWRYDPIFLSTITDPAFHVEAFRHIARELRGCTTRCVVSIVHRYRKIERRIKELASQGIHMLSSDEEALSSLMGALAEISSESALELRCCTDELGLERYGVQPGKCVDDGLIAKAFGLEIDVKKDARQRKNCGCVASRDIGMYDSCPYGCVYCYATTSFERARANHRRHDPGSASLLG